MSIETSISSHSAALSVEPLIPASIRSQIAAAITDLIVVTVLCILCSAVPFALSRPSLHSSPNSFGMEVMVLRWFFAALTQFLIVPIAYHTILVGRYSATLGKKFCSIKVVHKTGRRVGYFAAFTRFICSWFSTLLALVGYLIAVFDSDHRTLHDRIAGTLVVLERTSVDFVKDEI